MSKKGIVATIAGLSLLAFLMYLVISGLLAVLIITLILKAITNQSVLLVLFYKTRTEKRTKKKNNIDVDNLLEISNFFSIKKIDFERELKT